MKAESHEDAVLGSPWHEVAELVAAAIPQIHHITVSISEWPEWDNDPVPLFSWGWAPFD